MDSRTTLDGVLVQHGGSRQSISVRSTKSSREVDVDFDEAIKAHAGWKLKLSTYLRNPDGSLNARELGGDRACALGKWLHGEGKKYSAHPAYAGLVSHHASFHRCAAELVTRADRGEKVVEEVAFGAESPYSVASKQVVALITSIRRDSR
jgi:Chemoreceptor zinc-binding domain